MKHVVRTASLLALLLGLAPAPDVCAQEVSQEQRAEASEHFDRGLVFFEEERYDAALAELARAYELVPAHQTLYNIAQVHAALGHAVEAASAYERYLAEAGEQIGARRRGEAEAALAEQRTRIGWLELRCDVDGATVSVDGVDVATSPLPQPIPLAAGSHAIELRAPGRETVRRAVAIAGRSTSRLEVELRTEVVPRGTLRITSALSEVAIHVDDEPIGLTPLASTLPLRSGSHRVRASRPGYRTEERTLRIEEGAEAELHFAMHLDPDPEPEEVGRLDLRLPPAPYLVRVDGEPTMGGSIELPVGTHEVTIEVTDRRPYEGTVRVPAASVRVVVPPLAWTLDARRARVDAANGQRDAGWVTLAIGVGITLTGLGLVTWNEAEIASTDNRLLEVNATLARCEMTGFTQECEDARDEGEQLQENQAMQNVVRGVSVGTTLLGAALAGLGLGLALSAPSEDEVDASAHAELRVGLGGVAVIGGF